MRIRIRYREKDTQRQTDKEKQWKTERNDRKTNIVRVRLLEVYV
jgi:hypothetical protein